MPVIPLLNIMGTPCINHKKGDIYPYISLFLFFNFLVPLFQSNTVYYTDNLLFWNYQIFRNIDLFRCKNLNFHEPRSEIRPHICLKQIIFIAI